MTEYLLDDHGKYVLDFSPMEMYGILQITTIDFQVSYSVIRYFTCLERLQKVLGNRTGYDVYVRLEDEPSYNDKPFDPSKDQIISSIRWFATLESKSKLASNVSIDSIDELVPPNDKTTFYQVKYE